MWSQQLWSQGCPTCRRRRYHYSHQYTHRYPRRLRLGLIASLMLAALLLLAAAPAAAQFKDVDPSAAYAPAINLLAELGIARGYTDGTFGVTDTLTREQFAVFVIRAMQRQALAESFADYTTAFRDNAAISAWARGHIYLAATQQILSGYPDDTVRPQGQVTYAEALTMLVRALGFNDHAEQQGGWPIGYLNTAELLGLTKDLNVASDAPINRGDMAIALYNALYATTKQDNAGRPEPDVSSSWLAKLWRADGVYSFTGTVQTVRTGSHTLVVSGRSFKYDSDTVFRVNGAATTPATRITAVQRDQVVEVRYNNDDEPAATVNILANTFDHVLLPSIKLTAGTTDSGELTVAGKQIQVTADTQILLDGKKVSLAELARTHQSFQTRHYGHSPLASIRVAGVLPGGTLGKSPRATYVSVITANIVSGTITSTGADRNGSYAVIGGKRVYYTTPIVDPAGDVTWLLGSDNVARVPLQSFAR